MWIKVIKFSISPYRKNLKLNPKPIARSKYAEYLWQIGWKGEKTNER